MYQHIPTYISVELLIKYKHSNGNLTENSGELIVLAQPLVFIYDLIHLLVEGSTSDTSG